MIPKEQIQQIKQQLIQQIQATFPEDKKAQGIQQIESMNEEQLIEFLKQNNLISTSPESQNQQPQTIQQPNPKKVSQQKCIFCSIASGETQSYKIDENKDSIAVLELNPISKGHSLVIPKNHILSSGELPATSFSLAKKISKKIKTRLKPRDVLISSTNLFGHEFINIIPVYSEETPESQRYTAEKKELENIKKKLEVKKRAKAKKKVQPKKTKEEKINLPKRFP